MVVDASVAVKWYVPEKHYEKAIKLRNNYIKNTVKLLAPNLILYEVANALRFHKIYKLDSNTIASAVKSLKDFEITRELSEEEWEIAVNLSLEKNISIYDAVYAAVAKKEKATLITSDKTLYETLKNIVNTLLLENY